jgi:hypothetical protein
LWKVISALVWSMRIIVVALGDHRFIILFIGTLRGFAVQVGDFAIVVPFFDSTATSMSRVGAVMPQIRIRRRCTTTQKRGAARRKTLLFLADRRGIGSGAFSSCSRCGRLRPRTGM